MRGTKLEAWLISPMLKMSLGDSLSITLPESETASHFIKGQELLDKLEVISRDVQDGLLETVGIESELRLDQERAAMVLHLPPETDCEYVARAIALENADAWCDENGRVNLGISPNYTVKDVDQTVLSAIKVIHVLLGLHAVCEVPALTLKQKILLAVTDILKLQSKQK